MERDPVPTKPPLPNIITLPPIKNHTSITGTMLLNGGRRR